MSDPNLVVFPDGHVRDLRLRSFKNFLYVAWKAVGLPVPTPIQYDIADFLQYGPDRIVLEAFRGVGKSWLAGAFNTWTLYWNVNEKILTVSQAKAHSDDMSTFILQLINIVPGCAFLSPDNRERKSKVSFDVGPAAPAKQPSVKSVGITGQMTGSRAGVILADDIESLNNSLTQAAREKIAFLSNEFESIVTPSFDRVVHATTLDGEPIDIELPTRSGRIIFLGTPQLEDSLYNRLPDRGYTIRIYPAEFPDERRMAVYGDRLAPFIRDQVEEDFGLVGKPTEPERFGELDLAARRAGHGRSGYDLQFMLDTTMSDDTRYPLKLRDLFIMGLDGLSAPEKLIWTPMSVTELDLPAPGLKGDKFYSPIIPEKALWQPYQGTIMYIDPAGTGQDETAYSIVKQCHGLLYVPEATGIAGGYNDSALITLATRAKVNGVNKIIVESNFGDGMFTKLLQPHLMRIYPCTIEEIHSVGQKERRIIDVLEPVMNQHRLVIDRRVVENDQHRRESLPPDQAVRYELFYQMTRLTKDRGALAHDDRIEALAGGVQYWVEAMGRDIEKSAQGTRNRQFDEELKDFFKHTVGLAPKYSKGTPKDQRRWTGGNAGLTR